MKKLGFFVRFIFICILLLSGVISIAQTPSPAALSGNGTSENPYQISSVSDWNAFAAAVNAGYSYSGEFVKLTADIGTAENPVTTMVGNLVDINYYSFKGTFDGDNHILTFHYDYTKLLSAQRLNRVAPFRYINGATIKNLRVAGDINMDKPYAGGLFCVNDIYEDSKSNIIDCTVSVNITGYKDNCGGFAATALNTTFTRCVYNGRLNIGRNSGGFSSQGNKKTIIENCLCAPAEDSEIWSRSGNFVYNKNVVITNSYYTLLPNETQSLLTQGTRAYTSVPPAEPAVFTHYRTLIDGNNYYVEGNATIINLPDGYDHTGSEIPVTYGMTFEGTALTETTDYIASFSPSPVIEIRDYTLTLSGNNSNNYYGSISQTFTVIDGHLEGGGTAEDPYLIENEHDWSVLTNRVVYGTGCDSYYKLAANLSINEGTPNNTIIGTTEHPFTGHFDGGWHTLDITINRTGIYAAPFGVVDGATIENLKVVGTISTDNKFAGGIVGWVNNTGTNETHINNCISAVNIESSVDGDGSHGGLAGQVENGLLKFENCAFEGNITGAKTERCAGFVSWRQGKVEYNNCTMAGTISIADNPSGLTDNTANFHRNGGGSFTNAYYITPSTQQYYDQGTEITSSATAPTDGIYRKYTVSGNNYYVPCVTISGLELTTFSYSGEEITLAPTITYYGWTLTKDTDYTVGLTYSATEEGDYSSTDKIQEAGYYKMTITGIKNYGGSKVYTIHVININSWSVLKETLAAESGMITIYNDLIDASNVGALVVSHNMVLDLNGHTLNRNRTEEEDYGYVIKVGSGASLTIINGTITGGWNSESGGGICSEGDLTLNGVVVVNNKCKQLGGGIYCNGGSFNMTGGGIIRNQTTYDDLTTAGGGGIHVDYVTAFEMNNVTVTENTTVSKGGGVRFRIGKINAYINNCTITKNVSNINKQSKGGGIYFESTDNNGRLNVNGGLICVNTVSTEGGAVYVNRGIISLQDCELLGNVSGDIGGALSVYGGNHGKIIINGCGINGNSSKNQGGGVYVGDGATIEIQGELRIIGNESKDTESNNLYLAKSDEVIKVVGSLPGAVIGVSRSGTGTLTSGLAGHGTIGNFISECGTRVVLPVGGEAYLQNYYIWGVTEGWPDLAGVTKDGDNYTFNAIVVIPNGRTVTPSKIVVESGGIVVADGGQLVYTNTSFPVSAKVQRNIEAADSKDDVYGWYTIASPVNEPNITGATNLITMNGENPTYDLMRYDEPNHYWRSYRSETASTYFVGDLMVNGLGYLYRNANNVTVEFNGLIHSGDVTCSVTNSGDLLPGFNLIGNPFTHDITFSNISLSAGDALTGGYVLNKAGSWSAILAANTSIKPCQGVLVQVSENATATISHTARGRKASEDFISFVVANGQYEDVAYAIFGDGRGLSKIDHQNPDIPMIYIHQDDEDYAIATMEDDTKTFNLDFVAKTTGNYTLSVKPEGKFSYLHLIDKIAEKDIDLLKENEYSFIGSTADNAERFIVRLEHSEDAEGSVFAYQSGNDIVVSGEGELQVFDVTGRMVATQHVNGVGTWRAASVQTGVYILRLNDKTQKMVIR
ncbi:MAG: T9SS type A sorting domain-containing protein [Bacteroidales bacterium]|nr:T9SS type A sorting domain-containing protein [Bacteroidales bacterium]